MFFHLKCKNSCLDEAGNLKFGQVVVLPKFLKAMIGFLNILHSSDFILHYQSAKFRYFYFFTVIFFFFEENSLKSKTES